MADKAIGIRKAVSSDIPILVEFDHGYNTDHVWQMAVEKESNALGFTFRETRLPRPMRVRYPRQPELLIEEWTHKAAILIADQDGDPVAYTVLQEGPAEDAVWMTDLVVDLRHRRQGVATKLLHAAHTWCVERGIGRLFLEMQSKNYPAIQLARKNGFVFAGYSDQYYPDQEIALFFSKQLR
jgi:GNAT superfamily N-acetyltransferase